MADHLEDDEQVEALKRWWDENGRSTIVAVILAVGGTLGWQQYQDWDAQQPAAAADPGAQAEAALNADVPSLQAEGERLAPLKPATRRECEAYLLASTQDGARAHNAR